MNLSLRPDFGSNGKLFPPLPEIKSLAIKLQVFTHRSFHARPTHVFEDHPGDLSPDNERLEHLGDTVLGLCITSLLMETFPGLRVGPSTKIRAMVVGNPTLSEISLKYKLPENLRLHPAQAITLRASTNIRADVFEAFVGGLYIDQGLDVVRSWLYKLLRPYALSAYQIARQQHGLPPLPPSFPINNSIANIQHTSMVSKHNFASVDALSRIEFGMTDLSVVPTVGHLALFNQLLQKANRTVEWVYDDPLDTGKGVQPQKDYRDMGLLPELIIKGTKETPLWYVKVLVDGEFYGRGRGNTKKLARDEAAKEGLRKLGIKFWTMLFLIR